jgi:hypothetical protein
VSAWRSARPAASAAKVTVDERRRSWERWDQDPVPDEPELVLPDPDELPEWVHPLAIDGGEPVDVPGVVDGVEVPDEPDVPDAPVELVEDPDVDDDSTAVEPVVDGLALVEAPAMDIPTPKLRPKAPRATPVASNGFFSFMG